MDRQPPGSVALPRPGRALKWLMVVIGVLGVSHAFLAQYVPVTRQFFAWLECDYVRVLHGEVWRLLTSGVLTSPEHLSNLFFTLIGLYFLGTDLERRWGPGRFLRFLGMSVVLGNLMVMLVSALLPIDAQPRFHPWPMIEVAGYSTFGAMAAITAIAIAWSRENAHVQARLFFVIPVSGRILFWVTIGFCVLDLIYPMDLPEGVVAPFGGIVCGLLFAGNPSVVRTLYLKLKLAVLRRRGRTLRVDDVMSLQPRHRASGDGIASGSKRSRAAAPPLRIVQGGLDDVLRNRKPPKDKRHLN